MNIYFLNSQHKEETNEQQGDIDMNIEEKIAFINDYEGASNAASGSKYDPNANVTTKNIATLATELPKKDFIDLNRELMKRKLTGMYGADLAEQYFKDLKHHIIYKHDETSIFPYCCSISLYPFLLNGLKSLQGTSAAPKHADSFCGSFINLIFCVAAQFAGATSTPEFLTYLDHFLRIDYGSDYTHHLDRVIEQRVSGDLTLRSKIENLFQQVVYTINQPAAARGNQSVFWNIAYFDKYYFANIFKGFYFPDGDRPNYESVAVLQKMFMKWFNRERTKEVLTFPVETMNLLSDGQGDFKDQETAQFAAEMLAEGHSFFIYQSDSVDALASCCRLRNAIDTEPFSFTLGAGGIETGSKGVITMNLNRIVQDWKREGSPVTLKERITEITERVHKYLIAFNSIIWDYYNAGLLQIYNAGYISLDKQYLTVGINGFVEGAEFLGYSISPDDANYRQYAQDILTTIKELNRADKSRHCKFNTEFVPAESLGVKNAKWDREDGYQVPREVYNSYFYVVEDTQCSPLDKFRLMGKDFTGCLDGGSALHLNLDEHLSKEQYITLMKLALKDGCNYVTFNIPNTLCKSCGFISKHHLKNCPKCNSSSVDYLTRVIGYLKRVSNFSEARQKEASRRYYAKVNSASHPAPMKSKAATTSD